MEIPTVQQFFEAFFGQDLGGAFLEIRTLPDKKQIFCTTISEAVEVSVKSMTQHTYFGVGLRREQKGDEVHVGGIPALWADLDAKKFGDKRKAGEVLGRFEFPPSIIVDSGNGWHAYWLLKESEDCTAVGDRLRLRGYLKGLQQTLNADPTQDLGRVLRVPGTFNHKTIPPKPVRVVRWFPERRYNLIDFDPYRVHDHVGREGVVHTLDWEVILSGVPEGWRDQSATSLAGRYFSRGLMEPEVWILLNAWNTKNVPPMETEQLRKCMQSVASLEGRKREQRKTEAEGAVRSVAELAEDYTQYIEQLAKRKILFGLPAIDRATRGVVPGEVAFVMARSKVGKSLFVQNLLRWFAHSQQSTLFISLEQPGRQVFERYVQMEVGVSGQDVEERWVDTATRQVWLAQMAVLQNFCWTVDKGSVKTEEIVDLVHQAQDRAGQLFSCVAVDYLGYLNMNEEGHTPYERTSVAAKAMKRLAKGLELPFIVLAQVGRDHGGEGNLPLTMDCGRDSGVVEEAADIQLGLYQPKMKVEEGSLMMTLAVQVLANRKGPRTEEWYAVDRRTLRINSEPVEREWVELPKHGGRKQPSGNGRYPKRGIDDVKMGEEHVPF